jgi:membrane-bound lytic murein transglycosylase D
MERTEKQYHRLWKKFKIITTESVVQTVKKEPKTEIASADVKVVVEEVKIIKEVRTDTFCEYCHYLYCSKAII